MSKELEIEFKNLLTQEEYKKLLDSFGYTGADALTQINHYFDTTDFQLRAKQSALRIRQKETGFECTLKTPAKHGHYEITDVLTLQQTEDILESRAFAAPEVARALQELNIATTELKLLGSLTTHRIEFPYKHGLMVLDHSQYYGIEDYEVEYEVEDFQEGKDRFQVFLKEYDIPVRETDKKISRFMKAANSNNSQKSIE